MFILELFSKWIEWRTCKHKKAVICKFDENGDRLPVPQQYYRCLSCHKALENLNYLT